MTSTPSPRIAETAGQQPLCPCVAPTAPPPNKRRRRLKFHNLNRARPERWSTWAGPPVDALYEQINRTRIACRSVGVLPDNWLPQPLPNCDPNNGRAGIWCFDPGGDQIDSLDALAQRTLPLNGWAHPGWTSSTGASSTPHGHDPQFRLGRRQPRLQNKPAGHAMPTTWPRPHLNLTSTPVALQDGLCSSIFPLPAVRRRRAVNLPLLLGSGKTAEMRNASDTA